MTYNSNNIVQATKLKKHCTVTQQWQPGHFCSVLQNPQIFIYFYIELLLYHTRATFLVASDDLEA